MSSWCVAHAFLNDFEIIPVVPIITGITFVFTFHMRCISIVRFLYFRIFSASFLITFLSHEIATSINIHVPFSLSRIMMSGLLLGMVLSVCTCWFTIWLPCLLDLFLLILVNNHTSVFCPIVPLFPCICWSVVVHTFYRVFLCTVLLPVLDMLILCGQLSHRIIIIIIIIITYHSLVYMKLPFRTFWKLLRLKYCGVCF